MVSLGSWFLFIWQCGKVNRQQQLTGTAEEASICNTKLERYHHPTMLVEG